MPFSVPGDYFANVQQRIITSTAAGRESSSRKRTGAWQILAPYAAMAAMFAMIVFGGKAILEDRARTDESEYDSFFYTELMPVTGADNMLEVSSTAYVAESGLSNEDIIDYLIYSGIPVESLNENEYE